MCPDNSKNEEFVGFLSEFNVICHCRFGQISQVMTVECILVAFISKHTVVQLLRRSVFNSICTLA